jgi:hypothetical protein
MRVLRVLLPLSCAVVLVALGFAGQARVTQNGFPSPVDRDTAAGARMICADAFEDPRPYCRGCCGSFGQVRHWARCCDEGTDTDCGRFCNPGRGPQLTEPEPAWTLAAP